MQTQSTAQFRQQIVSDDERIINVENSSMRDGVAD